ncbi:MAG: hypothetical protein WBE76_22345 [Terracidiphilus sp.]
MINLTWSLDEVEAHGIERSSEGFTPQLPLSAGEKLFAQFNRLPGFVGFGLLHH